MNSMSDIFFFWLAIFCGLINIIFIIDISMWIRYYLGKINNTLELIKFCSGIIILLFLLVQFIIPKIIKYYPYTNYLQ